MASTKVKTGVVDAANDAKTEADEGTRFAADSPLIERPMIIDPTEAL